MRTLLFILALLATPSYGFADGFILLPAPPGPDRSWEQQQQQREQQQQQQQSQQQQQDLQNQLQQQQYDQQRQQQQIQQQQQDFQNQLRQQQYDQQLQRQRDLDAQQMQRQADQYILEDRQRRNDYENDLQRRHDELLRQNNSTYRPGLDQALPRFVPEAQKLSPQQKQKMQDQVSEAAVWYKREEDAWKHAYFPTNPLTPEQKQEAIEAYRKVSAESAQALEEIQEDSWELTPRMQAVIKAARKMAAGGQPDPIGPAPNSPSPFYGCNNPQIVLSPEEYDSLHKILKYTKIQKDVEIEQAVVGGAAQACQQAQKEQRKAAEQGDAHAQATLGSMYNTGEGVPQDYAEAVKWYRKAAEQGNAYAQLNLGGMYQFGKGVPQDYVEAVKWYRKAAEQGYESAQLFLGGMYDGGHGVSQDYVEAVKWYRKAAKQGNSLAQIILGFKYRKGQGVPQNYAEAAKWFRMAADQGAADTQYLVGVMYSKGQGVPQDFVQAHKWFNLSAANNRDKKAREKAIIERDLVARKMTPTQIAEAQKLAREWKPSGSKE